MCFALVLLLFAGGFAFAVVDGARSVAADHLSLLSLRGALDMAIPSLSQRLQDSMTHISSDISIPAMMFILNLPVFSIMWAMGTLLYLVLRPKEAGIGHISRR